MKLRTVWPQLSSPNRNIWLFVQSEQKLEFLSSSHLPVHSNRVRLNERAVMNWISWKNRNVVGLQWSAIEQFILHLKVSSHLFSFMNPDRMRAVYCLASELFCALMNWIQFGPFMCTTCSQVILECRIRTEACSLKWEHQRYCTSCIVNIYGFISLFGFFYCSTQLSGRPVMVLAGYCLFILRSSNGHAWITDHHLYGLGDGRSICQSMLHASEFFNLKEIE